VARQALTSMPGQRAAAPASAPERDRVVVGDEDGVESRAPVPGEIGRTRTSTSGCRARIVRDVGVAVKVHHRPVGSRAAAPASAGATGCRRRERGRIQEAPGEHAELPKQRSGRCGCRASRARRQSRYSRPCRAGTRAAWSMLSIEAPSQIEKRGPEQEIRGGAWRWRLRAPAAPTGSTAAAPRRAGRQPRGRERERIRKRVASRLMGREYTRGLAHPAARRGRTT
jgi:hypothetical protein